MLVSDVYRITVIPADAGIQKAMAKRHSVSCIQQCSGLWTLACTGVTNFVVFEVWR